jgi:predicted ATPase/DNA-binding CsgD family transcriptional regulator
LQEDLGMPGTAGNCVTCGARIDVPAGGPVGRIPRYCSNACRQRAYRQRSRSGSASEGPAAAADPPVGNLPPGQLPAPLDSFVGRVEELVSLGRLLRANRLLTVVGPAGVGKTRLARELAGKARRSFPDGVFLIELGALRHSELVPQAVATTLAVSERPGVPLLDSVCAVVGQRRVLLVLDNCEHLLEACGRVAVTLLGHCAGMRIMATSRELLRVPGEVAVTGRELPAADAARLFAERAAAAGAPVRPADAPLVESICARLDHVPLAIELAARLVHTLPLAEIGHRLEDRFGLLTMGSRLAGSRHQDLRSAIGWSHGLLTPVERAVFRRVALLPGGFSLDAAAAVSAGAGVPAAAVPEVVSALVAKSLLVPVPCPTGRARFRQLQSIRLYARERLAEHGEAEVTGARVVDWLAALAAPVAAEFTVPPEVDERLELEHGNLLAAADTPGAAAHRLLLVAVLVRCWIRRGQTADGPAWLASALREADPAIPHRDLALTEASWLAGWRGDHDEALRLAQQAVALSRQGGRPAALARSLAALGFAHQQRGEFGTAVASFAACLRQVRPAGTPLATAMCLNNLATAYLLAGSAGQAAAALAEALPVYRGHAEPGRLASMLHTAGAVALEREDLVAAAADFAEGLELLLDCSPGYQVRRLPYLLEGLGVVAVREGRPDRGLRLVAAARAARDAADAGREEPWWRERVEAALALAGRRLPAHRVRDLMAEGARLPLRAAAGQALAQDQPGRRGGVSGPRAGAAAAPAPAPRPGNGAVLSRREQDVVALLVEGLTNRQISTRLGISERTVEAHLEHVRTKLDLRSRTQVAAWGATNRLLLRTR